MHPVLFTFGPITLHTYGLCVALGALLAVWLAGRRVRSEGLSRDAFLDLALWVIVASIVGARVLYVLVEWRHFAVRPLDAFKLWDGGLVFYGGFALGALVSPWVARTKGLPLGRVADLTAPYVALGHAFGRVGCFFAGCCYGLPSAEHGCVFPALGDAVPRLPTQLYEAAFLVALFAFLLWLTPRRRFTGQVFWTYLAVYAAGRFLLEILRGDEVRGWVLWPWLHTSQAIAVLVFVASGVVLVVLGFKGRRGPAPRRSA